MNETPINPNLEQIVRQSLTTTKAWGWEDDERKASAAGTLLKYLESHSTMSDQLAQGLALKIVEEIMKEEGENEGEEASHE